MNIYVEAVYQEFFTTKHTGVMRIHLQVLCQIYNGWMNK